MARSLSVFIAVLIALSLSACAPREFVPPVHTGGPNHRHVFVILAGTGEDCTVRMLEPDPTDGFTGNKLTWHVINYCEKNAKVAIRNLKSTVTACNQQPFDLPPPVELPRGEDERLRVNVKKKGNEGGQLPRECWVKFKYDFVVNENVLDPIVEIKEGI